MRYLKIILRRLFYGEEGPVAVEYAVMLAMILMAMIGSIAMIGNETGGLWGNILNKLQSVGF